MELTVLRFSPGDEATLGLLLVDHVFACYTLEDQLLSGPVKIPGETAIPLGRYKMALRPEGGMHVRYAQKYPFHKGMLWLLNVPNFEWIYIHPGNTDDHTEGCILVGDGQAQNVTARGSLADSVAAYQRIYTPIANMIAHGGSVHVTVKELGGNHG